MWEVSYKYTWGEGRAKLITGKVHIFSQECGKWADKRGNETEDPRKLC